MTLVGRLTKQLKDKGVKDPEHRAYGILKKKGQATAKGRLTAAGKKRQNMTAAERAKDRQSKYSGGKHKKSDYKYDAKSNQAKLK